MGTPQEKDPVLVLLWDSVGDKIDNNIRKRFPKLSLIIPTYNCAQWIGITLNSIVGQRYHRLEVIVVDASSTDRTLEVVNGYTDLDIRLYSVKQFQIHEMINRGISLATGEYFQPLFPGDFFVSPLGLSYMGQAVVRYRMPDLLYCGCVLHDAGPEPVTMFRELSESLLKAGRQPTSIQSCWFKTTSIKKIGKLDTQYAYRAAFDLFCRFHLSSSMKIIAIPRILLDYEGVRLSYRSVMQHFVETLDIVYRYFGFFRAIMWICIQKDFRRLLKLVVRKWRAAFFP